MKLKRNAVDRQKEELYTVYSFMLNYIQYDLLEGKLYNAAKYENSANTIYI